MIRVLFPSCVYLFLSFVSGLGKSKSEIFYAIIFHELLVIFQVIHRTGTGP